MNPNILSLYTAHIINRNRLFKAKKKTVSFSSFRFFLQQMFPKKRKRKYQRSFLSFALSHSLFVTLCVGVCRRWFTQMSTEL